MSEVTRQVRRKYLFDMSFKRVSVQFRDQPRSWRRKLARAEAKRAGRRKRA